MALANITSASTPQSFYCSEVDYANEINIPGPSCDLQFMR